MEEKENVSTEANNELPAQTLSELMDQEFGTAGAPGANTIEKAEHAEAVAADAAAEAPEKAAEASEAVAAEVAPVKEAEASTEVAEVISEDVAFEDETKLKVAEMQNDAHPGIKFAELRRELRDSRLENERIISEGANSEEFQQLKLKAEQADNLQKQVTDLRSDLALNDYKSTSEFDSLVKQPLSEIEVLTKNIEEINGLTEGSILAAIKTTDQRIQNELIERISEEGNLNMRDQNRIYTAADRFLQIAATDGALKENASTRMQELTDMQVSQQSATHAQQAATLKAGIEGAFSRYEGRIPGFVTDDGLPTEGYKTLMSDASNVQLNNVEDASFAIMAATLLPDILNTNKDLMSQLAEKNKALAKFGKSAVPSGTPTEAAPTKSSANKPETFMEALANFDASGS